ncbi:MAG TPA: hypothetical protein VG934_01770 [Candidatus Paceibacterota bacterium]|nr:hypothetical protein [Candidatus Paceibacterota bacterium]
MEIPSPDELQQRQAQKEGVGPFFAIIIIIVLLLAGAVYFFINWETTHQQTPSAEQANS